MVADPRERANHCLTCRWWDNTVYNSQDTAIPANQKKRAACRRYPEVAWRFSTDWCGEYDLMRATDFVTRT